MPDALTGGNETVELWPLSQGEIDNSPDGFVDAAFRMGSELRAERTDLTKRDYLTRAARNASRLASALGISAPTVRRYVQILETIYLIRLLPGWAANPTTGRSPSRRSLLLTAGWRATWRPERPEMRPSAA